MKKTEMRNENTINIDKVSTVQMLTMLNEENKKVAYTIDSQIENIAKAVDMIAFAFDNGGRLFYIGAGTSGRLGVLDAAECPPTFGVSPEQVVGIIAGGDKCLRSASENAEDNFDAGQKDLKDANFCEKDVVVAISASGNAAYCVGALKYAKEIGGKTVSLCCNYDGLINDVADVFIVTDTGAEAITGSTRMKAGTAHKLVLNMLSTGAMIKTGKVYENYMINVKPVNEKLRDRCIRIISDISGESYEISEKALDMADGDIKTALEHLKDI